MYINPDRTESHTGAKPEHAMLPDMGYYQYIGAAPLSARQTIYFSTNETRYFMLPTNVPCELRPTYSSFGQQSYEKYGK